MLNSLYHIDGYIQSLEDVTKFLDEYPGKLQAENTSLVNEGLNAYFDPAGKAEFDVKIKTVEELNRYFKGMLKDYENLRRNQKSRR